MSGLSSPDSRIQVAIAVLYQGDQFLMQLRDNIPTIVYPGCWGLFGGHIEAGESPQVAVERELIEEIAYRLPVVQLFRVYSDDRVVRHVFEAELTVPLAELILGEGWDLGLLSLADIERGDCYSAVAGEVRPIGVTHQRVLLDYARSRLSFSA